MTQSNNIINQEDIETIDINELIKNGEIYYGSISMDAKVSNSLYIIKQYLKLTKEYYEKSEPNNKEIQLKYDNVLKAVELAEQLMP